MDVYEELRIQLESGPLTAFLSSMIQSLALTKLEGNDLATAGAALVVIPSAIWFGYRAFQNNKRKGNNKYPPLSPTGILETIQSLSGNDYPWFMLRTSKALNSSIFRIPLPIIGSPMTIVAGDLNTVRQVLTDEKTIKPPALYQKLDIINGSGVSSMFTSNGQPWHGRRKSVAPAFSSNHVRRMNRVALEKTELWIQERLRPMMEEGKSFDVAKEMIDVILAAVCETAFEYMMSDDEKEVFLSSLDLALKEFLFKSTVNPFRQWFGLFFPDRRRALAAAKELRNISFKIVNAYRKLESPVKGTIINQIMTAAVYKNDEERAADVLSFLVAGHDTTAYSISWILLELARNPLELARLQTSLAGMSPEEWSNSDALNMVIKEGVRLHPVSTGGSSRQIGKDMITSPTKYFMPKGSIIFMPFILLLRNPDIYGNNADAFVPSRWENATQDMTSAWLPFSLGKQNCIGQSLANAEMRCIVARICSEVDLKVENEGTVEYFLTLKPAGALLKASKRE